MDSLSAYSNIATLPGFEMVRRLTRNLDGVEEATAYGSPCLRVRGHMFACVAINKSAEPGSLMIRVPLEQRNDLVAEQPDIYYLTPHYEPGACVLVRLGRVREDALRDLLRAAWKDASRQPPRRASRKKKTAR